MKIMEKKCFLEFSNGFKLGKKRGLGLRYWKSLNLNLASIFFIIFS